MGWLKAILDGFVDSFDLDGGANPEADVNTASADANTASADANTASADAASKAAEAISVDAETEQAAVVLRRPPVNDAEAYGVRIEPFAPASGQQFWAAVRVRHLTPAENGGNHHIYLDVVDPARAAGADPLRGRVFGARLKVTWDGGEALVTVDKPLNEPGANFPLWKGQRCAVVALGTPGQELPSDRVTGLHTGHPDEAPGNTWGHHSFSITFELTQAEAAGGRPLAHYVLFGPAEQPATAVHLLLAQEYLLARRPAFGFSPAEAACADRVTIVAGEEAVSAAVVADLTAAGVAVERICGTVAEVSAGLAARMAR
jgi:hypothetical protein